jgi:hypothetical protein
VVVELLVEELEDELEVELGELDELLFTHSLINASASSNAASADAS